MLKGCLPYEILYGEKLDYEHLRFFGSLCYIYYRSRDKDKFGARSHRCVFFYYPFGQKGWKVFDLEKEEFFISHDVIFHEDIYPYTIASSSSKLLPQSLVEIVDDEWLIPPAPLSHDIGSHME